MNCPKHPDRPVIDAGVCTLQRCQECRDASLHAYSDYKGKREAWKYANEDAWIYTGRTDSGGSR